MSTNKNSNKTSNKTATANNPKVLSDIELLKKELETLRLQNQELQLKVSSKSSTKKVETLFVRVSQAIISSFGRGKLTIEELGTALSNTVSLMGNDDNDDKTLFVSIVSSYRHNIKSNIKKQKDETRKENSIKIYSQVLHTVNGVLPELNKVSGEVISGLLSEL